MRRLVDGARSSYCAAVSVYYLRVGSLIKIGTTGNLKARISQYPPGSELLAVEPGGREVETGRKQQFRHLLAQRREWFHPGPDLLAHIDDLMIDRSPGG